MWLKPLDIVNAESLDVVLILRGFHTIMSFVDSTGALMNGSGLSECLETEFGTNIVRKIMDEKAISRAICVHFLTEGSLMAELLATFVSATNVKVEQPVTKEVEEVEENVKMNDMNPDVVNEGTDSMNVASVFEEAGIR